MVTWLHASKLEPHTPCELWAQGETGDDPWPEMARGSWNSWELPEPPSGSRGDRRKGLRGRKAAESSRPGCRARQRVHMLLCAHACFRAPMCGSVWYSLRSLGPHAAKGGLVAGQGWPADIGQKSLSIENCGLRTPATPQLVAWDMGAGPLVSAEGTTGGNQGQVRWVHGGETEQDTLTHECTLTHWPTSGSLWGGPKGTKSPEGTY